ERVEEHAVGADLRRGLGVGHPSREAPQLADDARVLGATLDGELERRRRLGLLRRAALPEHLLHAGLGDSEPRGERGYGLAGGARSDDLAVPLDLSRCIRHGTHGLIAQRPNHIAMSGLMVTRWSPSPRPGSF